MLLIPCPNCGERDESELDYGGPVLSWPDLDSTPEQWHQVLHLRDNPRGEIEEYWYHSSGCECWIKINRNLVTHEIGYTSIDEANA